MASCCLDSKLKITLLHQNAEIQGPRFKKEGSSSIAQEIAGWEKNSYVDATDVTIR